MLPRVLAQIASPGWGLRPPLPEYRLAVRLTVLRGIPSLVAMPLM